MLQPRETDESEEPGNDFGSMRALGNAVTYLDALFGFHGARFRC
jgi:hypothetical protein